MNEREQLRLQIQSRLDSAKTRAERNQLGQFATPSALARQVVAAVLQHLDADEPVRFLDPGFGTGAFYSALPDLVGPERIEAASGFEIDPRFGTEAKALWHDTPLDLRIMDFAQAVAPQADDRKFNVIICNPPYVRHHHLDRQRKAFLADRVEQQTGLRLNGLSGLYCYFLLLSQAWMAKRGIGVWLIPSEFLDVNYGRQVKRYLLEHVTLLRIHRFDSSDVQFADALVSSAVVFLRNERPAPNHRVEFTFGGSLDRPEKTAAAPLNRLGRTAKWTSFPKRRRSSEKKPAGCLADLFQIKRGLATGCNSFFVLSPRRADELRIPKRFLRPILPSPRYLPVDEIDADEEGHPLLESARFLVDCKLDESEIRRESPELWAYLQSGLESGIDQRYLCRRREPWYSQERRVAAPFLCTYMGRSSEKSPSPFRFILNHSRAIAANVYLFLYPRHAWFRQFLRSRANRRKVWTKLLSLTVEDLVSEGRQYGGGLHKIEPKELANVSAEAVFSVLPQTRSNRQRVLF